MLRTLFLAIPFLFIYAPVLCAADTLPFRGDKDDPGARVAELVHTTFHDHRIASPRDACILIGPEHHSFGGDADKLNQFLKIAASIPLTMDVVLQGPDGHRLGEPLTSSAAQAGVGYDWSIQWFEGKLTAYIPLGNRVPFSSLKIPRSVKTEAESGAPKAASTFCRLHNASLGPVRTEADSCLKAIRETLKVEASELQP